MVTAMTGGYDLLVAAALAVILSSLVQTLLSSSLKYKSLYEAQVPSRPYSPSHYVEQVRVALELLGRPDLSRTLQGRGLELVSLAAAGVPIKLVEGKQIRMGTLRAQSSCVGQPVESGCLGGMEDDVKWILVMRGNQALWPRSDLKLEAGDRLVAVASDAAWANLAAHLDKAGPLPLPKSHETHVPNPEAALP